MGRIKIGAALTVIGEAPGLTEVEEGRIAAGQAGEVVYEALKEGGLDKEDVSVTNAILCRPPGGHMLEYAALLKQQHVKAAAQAKREKREVPPLITPQDCCAPRLAHDIAESGAPTLLALGTEGLKAVAHYAKLPFATAKAVPGQVRVAVLKKQHGAPVLVPDGRVITSALHPAFALYGNSTFLPVIRADIRRAATIALRGGRIDWQEPEFILKPSADTCVNVIDQLYNAASLTTLDIETDGIDVRTAKIRCIGLGAVVDGRELIICIPLRHMDGRAWWSYADEMRIRNALTRLLEKVPLSGHNLAFDTAVLLMHRILFNRGKRWFDCYLDNETEFLTQRGWLKYDDVRPADKLATVAPSTNALEWQQYTERVDKRRKGFLYEVETNHTRAVITPGHTIWHQKTKRSGQPTSDWRLTPAEKLVKESGGDAIILRACRPDSDGRLYGITSDGFSVSEPEMKFFGLAIADGTIRFHCDRPYRLRISQKVKGRAYEFLQHFEAYPLVEHQYDKKEPWRKAACTESMWEVPGALGEVIAERFNRWFGRYSTERTLPPWVFTLPVLLRRALLEGLLLGDASEVGKATIYRSYSKLLADGVQALALTLGIPATLNSSGKCWNVNMCMDLTEEVQVVTREGVASTNGIFTRRPDDWYRVVCFVVPNHTLVTRSGGRPAFFGNTMLAHHNTNQSELPHDLGFVASRNFEAPRWKDDADHKNVEGVDDYWLHLYCMFRGTPVVMADGSTKLIEDLVRTKSTAKVMAVKDGRLVTRRITGWHKQKVAGQKWLNLRIERQRDSERGIVCTPDHELLVAHNTEQEPKWRQAQDVRVGEVVLLPQRRLYVHSRRCILGTLLGDSSLQWSPAFRERAEEAPGASIQGGHVLESGLAQMKRDLLPDLFTRQQEQEAHEVKVTGRHGQGKPFLSIWSMQHRELAELRPLFYDKAGQRRLRVEVLDQLHSAGLAWWFMDDGCRQAGQRRLQNTGTRGGASHDPDSIVFSTQRYPAEDVAHAAAWFSRYYGPAYACSDGTLRLSYKASAALAEEIAPYVFPNQRYKLPHGIKWPEFKAELYVGRAFVDQPVQARVESVTPFEPTESMRKRGDADTRYCIDVEDAHCFFTPWGLVHNCAKDVLGEMRLVLPLIDQMNQQGTINAFKTDTTLAPIARDMGDLGLNIDEVRRRRYFDILDVAVNRRIVKLRALTGLPDFNPNAFKQVSRYLYVTKGLVPPYATDGREWSELSDEDEELPLDTDDPEVILAKAATNELSLLRLLELGVDDHTRQFIEAQLEYRGLQKCKSTYLGLKYEEDDTGKKVIIDTHRKRGFLHVESHGPGLEMLSIFHTNWKLHVVPTGRWATSPNCFDGETELLTRRGWVKFPDCDPASDEVAQTDPVTGAVEFVRPTAWIRKPFEGELYHFTSQQLDICCTADHRIPMQRRNGNWEERTAATWVADRQLRQSGFYAGGSERLTEDEVILLCATQADGTFDRRSNCISFQFSKKRKIERLLQALQMLGVAPQVTIRRKETQLGRKTYRRLETRIYVPSTEVVRKVCELLGPSKEFGPWLLHYDRQTLDLLSEEVWRWDGLATRRTMFSSSQKTNADWVQVLTVLSGRRAKLRSYFPAAATTQKKVNWQVDASDRSGSWTTGATTQRVPYKGEVWCVSVPSTFILTRRNGRVTTIGQCQNWPERVVWDVDLYRAALAAGRGTGKNPFRIDGSDGIINTRAIVCAPPGYTLIGADYAAVELRIYAIMAQDALLLDAIYTGKDPHALNYATMMARHPGEVMTWYERVKTSPETVKKYLRNIAKRFAFLVIYGGQKDQLYKTMAADRNPDGTRSFPDLKPNDCAIWFDNFHRSHPETRRWHEAVVRAWTAHGFVATIIDGRRRFFIGGLDPTAMPNMTIQGSAAAVANRAMITIAERCPHRGWGSMAGPILQVHDYIGLQVPDARVKEAEELLDFAMPYTHNGMTFAIERKTGQRWDQT